METRYTTSKFFSHSSWPTKMHAKYHIMAIKSIYDFYAEKWHEIFEKKRDDTYAASSGSSAGKPGGSFDQLGKSIYMITEALDFNMKYTEPKV